jgi:hypothetical protein
VAGLVVARISGRDQLAAELSAELVDRGVVGLLGVDAISTPFVRPPTGAPPKELSCGTGSGKRLVGGHCPLDLFAETREE